MTGPMWMPQLPPTLARLLAWHPQPVPVIPLMMAALLALYLLGVWRLRRRGDRWPIQRTIWWASGIASVLLVTATGIDGYGMELFSVHMVQHMTLSMLSPVFLVLGAPVTLLLRALPTKPGGGTNPRKLILRLLHSRLAGFVTHPVVTITLFLMSLYGLYFTPAFDFLMGSMWGHNVMLIHFLLIGLLYFWGVMGVDPSPRQARRGMRRLSAPVLRIFELFITVPFHAVDLIVHFYSAPNPSWGVNALADQALGGGIAWGFTELPTLIVLGVLFLQWQKSERRHELTSNRKADADGDADRVAYNHYLSALARRDVR
jgi:putative membrane protein